MNRFLSTQLSIIAFFAISSISAVSLGNYQAVQNHTVTHDIKVELKEISNDAARLRVLALASQPFPLTESTTRRSAIVRPFNLWWSIFTQSLLQLKRLRAKKTEATFSLSPDQSSISTTTAPYVPKEDVAHNVNDIAAGLEAISIDAPVFDFLPLE
ncbi:uncharacterized protein LOC130701167 [Daphnia carinata]|uniref:uncharacterized protein LOC130701167 n=1 Tax=Daphnia carinata TaxID=120202 RepID=UPI00257F8F2E|nr:uncharacterized protein LOC130701167 [Daphnia carinata]